MFNKSRDYYRSNTRKISQKQRNMHYNDYNFSDSLEIERFEFSKNCTKIDIA